MPLPGARRGDIASDLNAAVRLFVKARGLGRVFGNDSGFQINLAGSPHTVLGADVSFVRADRLPPQDDPVWDGYLPLAPDLVVEIASPSQYRPGLARKAQRWLRAGTRMVWVVWPGDRQVDVWRPGHARPIATLGQGENLEGLDVLPGFVYAIGDLFT
jgi:Uma2 family endonuclease